jgi:hypothetical protein
VNGAAIGAMVGAGFGGLWAVAGSLGLPGRARMPAIVLSLAVTAGLVAAAALAPGRSGGSGTFDGTVYGIAVAAESIAIAAAAALLRQRRDLLLPAVGFIVGLHFIGLWKATALTLFLAVAGGMCAVSLGSLLLRQRGSAGFAPRQAAAGLGCAIVLWASAAIGTFGPL